MFINAFKEKKNQIETVLLKETCPKQHEITFYSSIVNQTSGR